LLVGTPTVDSDRVPDHGNRRLTDRLAELGDGAFRRLSTPGDGFLATFEGPTRAIRCALAIARSTAELGIGVRVGVNSGECLVRRAELSGIAAPLASLVGATARPHEVLVTSTVHDLVAGSDVELIDCGEYELKGVAQRGACTAPSQ